ncbi:MAG TPA: phosphate-starvation-inducible PsiE family protein [Gammaproteobacteria bacterium]|nr:phosphate-starvation-inducible PsiE family protein [Gammaproteobacteria bacterium]
MPENNRPAWMRWLAKVELDSQALFDHVINLVFRVLTLLVIVALIGGVIQFFLGLGKLWESTEISESFGVIITDMLTLFVLVELLRSLVDYFTHHRLRMTYILDAALVFVVRELMIKLYAHGIVASEVYPMAVLILVLGVVRTGAVLVFQQEQRLAGDLSERAAGGRRDPARD